MTETVRPRPSTPVLIAGLLGLALIVVGVVMFLVPSRTGSAAEPDQHVQIVARATEFVTQYNSYDASDLEDYQRRLDGLMTEEFDADNDKATETYFEVLAPKKQVSSDPRIKAVAVQDADADSATVLVAVDATISNTDLDEPMLSQMRWILRMQKEGGSWKVDAFESVGAQPVGGRDVGPTPSPSGTPTAPSTKGSEQ